MRSKPAKSGRPTCLEPSPDKFWFWFWLPGRCQVITMGDLVQLQGFPPSAPFNLLSGLSGLPSTPSPLPPPPGLPRPLTSVCS